MIDVKKFVVAFLVLAALASSSAFLLVGFSGASVSSVTANVSQTAGSVFTVHPGNAFAPTAYATSTESLRAIAAAAASTTLISDPNNLTQTLADHLLNNLVADNPDGPQADANGNPTITAPGPQSILADLSSSTAYKNVNVPDWDFEAATITTNIATGTSPDVVAQYSNALNSVINTYFVKNNLQGMVNTNGTADPSNLSYIGTQLQGALDNVSALTAPKDLADLHRSLIKVLVYQKNAIGLVQNASDDPVKAAVIFQAEGQKYSAAVAEFNNALQAAQQNKAFSFAYPHSGEATPGGVVAFFDHVLGIQTAHAQWIVFDPSVFMQMIWEFLQSVLLQILKNLLVAQMENTVLKLVQNSGNPRFVQQWGMLLYNTFNGAAGSALGQIIPGLCPQFGPSVSSWLLNAYPSANVAPGGFSLNGAGGTNCTLQNTVPNVPAFYNNFNTAGFNGFGALLSPNNNVWGSFAQAYDSVALVSGAQSAATQNKFTSGQGYSSGAQFCDDGSSPNPGDGNLCDDGSEPYTTFPGASVGDSVGRSLNSNIDLVVNANDITGLVASIATLLMQQVITNGVNGLIGSGAAAGGGPPPPPLPVMCNSSQSVASTSATIYFSATGGNGASYTWVSTGANPSSGSGSVFVTTYPIAGVYRATVTGSTNTGTQSSSCTITIN